MYYGSSVVRLPWENSEQKCDISHPFPHKPTVNIHILSFKSNLKNEYIYPSYQTNSAQGTIHIQYFILYIFYFCLSLHIFMLFSGKITSACKKLNKESEHKNFVYTYSWTCHVLLIQMYVIILQKQKYRNIGNKLQNIKL